MEGVEAEVAGLARRVGEHGVLRPLVHVGVVLDDRDKEDNLGSGAATDMFKRTQVPRTHTHTPRTTAATNAHTHTTHTLNI